MTRRSGRPRSAGSRLSTLGIRVLLVVLALVMFFPYYWMLIGSLKSSDEVLRYPPRFVPTRLQLQNYRQVFVDVPFARYILNSFIVAASVTAAALLFHSMAGFALACVRMPGKKFIFLGILSTMMIPFYSIMVPLFIICRYLGWIDTYWGLIVPWIPHAFGIFLYRQFFLDFPRDLIDAGKIDGCSVYGLFFRVSLPTATSISAVLAIIFFISNWDRFLWPLLITISAEMRVIQLGIVQFKGQYVVHWHLVLTAAVIGSIPTLLIFIFLQNRITEGIRVTGIKG
jgi:multiple sugar transport system permease protein